MVHDHLKLTHKTHVPCFAGHRNPSHSTLASNSYNLGSQVNQAIYQSLAYAFCLQDF